MKISQSTEAVYILYISSYTLSCSWFYFYIYKYSS